MRTSETRARRVSPRDRAGTILARTAAYEWETSDPHVLAVDITEEDRARGGA